MKRSLTLVMLLIPFLLGSLFLGYARDEGQNQSGRGWLGVSACDMTPKLARSMHVQANEGALVQNVLEDTPAEGAGIKEDDIIVEFNGSTISDSEDLTTALRKTKPGTAVSVVVSRKDVKQTLKATVEKAPRFFTAPIALRKGNTQKLSLRIGASSHHGTWFRSQSIELPDFDSHQFKREMEKFKEEMRSMGREFESHTREWKEKLREGLNRTTM